jgi:serine racemase
LGQLTFPIIRDHVAGVVVVSDAAIVGAMRLVFERMKVVVEPSGAAGLAAVLDPAFNNLVARVCPGSAEGAPLNVGVILCGGNLDFESRGFFALENWQA